MSDKKKVLVGMSGGVDSAAAAIMLMEQGFEVGGGTFKIWDSVGAADLEDARSVCRQLGIPHHTFDFREEFKNEVVERFAHGYESGVTPNPCVICNRVIKFGALLQNALELGYDRVATGHYAHIVYDDKLNRFRVKKSAFDKKDQSYVLYSLSQAQLGRAVLPLGNSDKVQIRELVKKSGLAISHKSESQDICFIPNGKYADFLTGYLGKDSEPGHFVDRDGKILGTHKGIRCYTIGQRKGLGLSFDKPMFVYGIDSVKGTVTLAPPEALMSCGLIAEHTNWIDFDRLEKPLRVEAKIRYGAKTATATLTPVDEGSVKVTFDTPQRAVTPGQSVVFYDGDYLVGGGIITR